MKTTTHALRIVCLAGMTCITSWGFGQQAADDATRQEQEMQKWIEFMTPGTEHELLQQRAGNWKVSLEMWTAPDTPATVADGTAQVRLVLGGRYLLDSTQARIEGRDFEGHGITGFDKLKHKFVSIWIDNFGTGFMMSTGEYRAATKTFEYITMSPNVELGDYKRTRTVERTVSRDEWILEMYDTTAAGTEFLTLKARYERVPD